MTGISRRALLAGAVVAGVGGMIGAEAAIPPRVASLPEATVWTFTDRYADTVAAENRLPGSSRWLPGSYSDTVAAVDTRRQVQAYASATSVAAGETIAFYVSAAPAARCSIEIWRLGEYGGAGGRLIAVSKQIAVETRPVPAADATGLLACDWPASAVLEVPGEWRSGLYLATFTTETGYRTTTPFVVRSDTRPADLCVVLPFTTFQAYNMWPRDHRTGKSLYLGFRHSGRSDDHLRALRVSFDRPYVDSGLPKHFFDNIDFISWAERRGYDLTYATSLDLHAGRVPVTKYRGLVFSGHDEYWSTPMRAVVEHATALGRNLAFLSANNMYWHIRMSPSAAGSPDRIVECYKEAPDPLGGPTTRTGLWRDLGAHSDLCEQQVLGVQYVGIVRDDSPLVIQHADHWMWAGTGARRGDTIQNLVGGEADMLFPNLPHARGGRQTLLSGSPFVTDVGTTRLQQTSLWETPYGGVTFTAGTFRWTRALSEAGYVDPRVQRATLNLLARMQTTEGRFEPW